MKKWKILAVLPLAILLIFSTCLFTGCKTKDYNVIELNEVTHSIFYAPLYVAQNRGFFKDEGLTVNLTNGGGSNVSMGALMSNSADIILAGPETVVYTQNEGAKDKPVVFGQLTACDGSFIVSKDADEEFDIENLKNETIIGGRAGGMPAMTLQYIIETSGLTIGTGQDEVNLRTDVEFNLVGSVWSESANVKYCTLFEPTATNMAREKEGKVVESLGTLSGRIPYTCFAAKQSYLKNHGDVAEKFIKAVLKGYDYIVTNDTETVARALLNSFETSLEDLEVAVEQYIKINAWSSDMILTRESFDNLMNILLHAKVIDSASSWLSVVDNSIVNKLKQSA